MASIEKRVRNGKTTYCVRYRDPNKKERRKVFARKVDAERWLIENESRKLKGAWVDPAAGKVLLGEQAERWFATKAALRPTTKRDYRKLLDQQVLPTFKDVPLAAIDALAVREWVAGLITGHAKPCRRCEHGHRAHRATAPYCTEPGCDCAGWKGGLSAKRTGKAQAVLSQVLASAVEEGRLARNVAAGIRKPKVQRAEMAFLTAEQVEALADAIRGPYGTLMRCMAYSGLRPAEVTALRVRHLDLLRCTVRVVESAPEVDGHLKFGGVKTHEARTIHLPRSIAEEVGASLAGRFEGRAPDPNAYVFPAPMGGPLRWSKFGDNYFKPALRAAGLPDIRPYDLRHTAASLMIRAGATIKAVQKQMGHRNASQTLDVYGHLFPDELPALAERMDSTRTAALTERSAAPVRPQRGPNVVPITESAGQ